MSSIIDYVQWRGDLRFDQASLCAVDFLIFAQLAHLPWENLSAPAGGRRLDQMPETELYPSAPGKDENTLIRSRYELWQALRGSARFGGVTLRRFVSHFDVENEKQFAGAAFDVGEACVVAFRGTDATLVGWKEDFNMGFESPVPSQQEAVAFLSATEGNSLYVCGHSKGGNLAMYSAAMSGPQVRARVKEVYSFDGPGMDQRTLESPGWRELNDRMHSLIPESSVVGLLLGYREDFTIIESSSAGVMQHNPYHWHVLGPRFLTAQETTLSSRFADKTLHDFLDQCTVEQRKTTINTLYSILAASGATRLRDLPKGVATHLDDVGAALAAVSPQERQAVTGALKILLEAGGENVRLLLGTLTTWRSGGRKEND